MIEIEHLLSIHERHIVWCNQKDFDEFYYKQQQDGNTGSSGNTVEQLVNTTGDTFSVTTNISLNFDTSSVGQTVQVTPQNQALMKMRAILKMCYGKIVTTCKDTIYKTIVSDILKKFENKFFIDINQQFGRMTEQQLDELFYETDDIVKDKKVFDSMLQNIDSLLAQSALITSA